MTVLFSQELKNIVEALLFVSNEPLTVDKLVAICESDRETIAALLLEIQQEYEEKAVHLVEIAGGWQLLTKPEYYGYIEKLYHPKTQQISKASLETLAIIAYRQPVTRQEIEQIRGVNADRIMAKLLSQKLIQEVGRRECPGRPILYGTTDMFLQAFGLKNLAELPSAEQWLEQMPIDAADRLADDTAE
ncbi:MAG: SMC-Scp complex subunit ScpB [Peptococcaceae bacterium]|nr:SMC-Scp complex subunit ScpB [Peptococcaceae bacterium]